MQRTPPRLSVPTNIVANGASGDGRGAGAQTRYGQAGLRERRRLDDLGLASSRTPVVRGRDAELASIGVQLDLVRSGVGAVVLVEGEPGMGKTRVLAEADRVAGRLAFRVGAGAAEPGAAVVELAPLMTALFEGSRPLLERSGLPELRSLPEQRYWLLQDLEMLLERAALDGPLLISLDDLQWADSGTAAALLALSVRLADLPVAWILAYRPNQGSAQVLSTIEQLDESGAERIVLGPLDDAAVAQVAEDVIDAEPDAALLDLVKGAHGSPFVLIELLSGLRESDPRRRRSRRADRSASTPPRRLHDARAPAQRLGAGA
ncbi:MAG: AAA family ATPase [Solirubrobacteraceae bacterium]